MKFFFSIVAGVGDSRSGELAAGGADISPPIDASALRKSNSRLVGTSTRTLTRPRSGTPFVAVPPNRETIATTSSATASSLPFPVGTVISLTPRAFGAGVSVAARSIDFAICSRIWASSRGRFGLLLSCLKINQRPMPTFTNMRTINATPIRIAILWPCSETSGDGGKMISRESPRIPAWICRATPNSRCHPGNRIVCLDSLVATAKA